MTTDPQQHSASIEVLLQDNTIPDATKAFLVEQERAVSAMQKQLDGMKRASEESEQKAEKLARENTIRAELARHSFPNQYAHDLVLKDLEKRASRLTNGALYIDGYLSLADAAKSSAEAFLGASRPTNSGSKPGPTMDDIRPGMSREEKARIGQHIAEVAGLRRAPR